MTEDLEYKGGLAEDWDIKEDRVRTTHCNIKFQAGPMKQVGKNGCSIEDVLRVTRARIRVLDALLPCSYNKLAASAINQALMELELRTADRVAREVEGTVEP